MLIVRPIEKEDLNQILELSAQAKAGLTTLPYDEKVLSKRIEQSVYSFEKKVDKPEGETYFFVLEDLENKKIVGTSAIVSKVGGFEPFYTYEIKTIIKESKTLGVKKEIKYLQLLRIHNGPSEIGTLFLLPEYRKNGNGRLLSLSRFLFMSQYGVRFESEVIAEMRGVIDENESSPFWEALAGHFFDVAFKKADLMVMSDKTFIADLIPQHPIYIPLLTQSAQDVIGKVHKNTEPALHLLETEGFRYNQQIDIFEAGPVMTAEVAEIRTIKNSQEKIVSSLTKDSNDSFPYLIANIKSAKDFRVIKGDLTTNDDSTIGLPANIAKCLGVEKGEGVRFSSMR